MVLDGNESREREREREAGEQCKERREAGMEH